MKRIHLIGWLLLLCSMGCSKSSTSATNPTTNSPESPLSISVTSPKKQTLNWTIEQPGTVQPFEMAPLVAKLPGYVQEVKHDLGDEVPAGTILATLSIPELEQEANQKRAMVALAEAEVEQARQGVRVAEEQFNSTVAKVKEAESTIAKSKADFDRWDSESKRFEALAQQKVVDQQTLEETKKQALSARATLEETSAKVTSAKALSREAMALRGRAEADLKAAEAKVRSADAEAKRLEALLTYREIKAPFPGVVTGRFVHAGYFLQPTSGAKAEPLFTFARIDKVRIFVDVPEAAASLVDVGTPATIRVPGLANKEWNVAVARTAKVLNPDTRTLKIELNLDRKEHMQIPRPGLYAYVRINATIQDALVVPAAAVLYADETAYVYIVKEGKALKHRVQVGRSDAKGIQVIAQRRATVNAGEFEPMTEQDQLIVGNLGALTDGQAVSVKPGN